MYYRKRLSELEDEIASLHKKLERYGFAQKMQQYTEKSMQLFRAKLAMKYAIGAHGGFYGAPDLKFKPEEFTADYPVILSTTYSLVSSLSAEYQYDYVIIDEASQVDIATGALAFSCAKKVVIVGDLKQLPTWLMVKREERWTPFLQNMHYLTHTAMLCIACFLRLQRFSLMHREFCCVSITAATRKS